MSEESRVSVLVCGDAGGANRVLLSRDDLRVRWALTEPEVAAVIKNTACSVCITRESFAKRVMASAAAAQRPLAVIVLLDPKEWATYREYMVWIDPYAAATSVMPVGSSQLLDALSDATGIKFRTAPRVVFRGDIRYTVGKTRGVWTAINISESGICIADLPPSQGDIALSFDILGQQFKVNAVMSRISRSNSRRVVGLAFRDVPPDVMRLLSAAVAALELQEPPQAEEEFEGLSGPSTTLAFRSHSVHLDPVDLARELLSGGQIKGATIDWLAAACDNLSAIEAGALRSPQTAPAWARDAVEARLRAFELRARHEDRLPSDAEFDEVLGMCKRMGENALGSSDPMLVQVTNIRGDILRAVYDPNLLINE